LLRRARSPAERHGSVTGSVRKKAQDRKNAQDRLRVAADFLTWLRKTETQPWPR